MKLLTASVFILLLLTAMLTPLGAQADRARGTCSAFNIWCDTTGVDPINPSLTGTCNVYGSCDFCDSLVVARNIINLLVELAIAISVAMMVYGAIRMMLSVGSPERVKSARDTITSALVGLLITLAAWLIVNTFLHILTGNADFPWAVLTCS